ncbi:hypothetical protein E2562_026718 [Oryza meyeriana var. granulata]|uniref:F-box domain-containing protein n=1 Tax=Oryza meyeriana var. granulata TaxID=110450 RepID=A0A6G1EZ98_9ORYZ|nr:hypothetical protein E2562_026718 [Oryza meyeriana var. granulata]
MARKRKRAAASSSSWSDLPPELMGLVLQHLHSHTDRVCVTAVCWPWRPSARLQLPLPPPMPWVVLGEWTYNDLARNASLHLDICCPVHRSSLSVGDRLFLTCRTGGAGAGGFQLNPFLFYSEPIQILDLAFFKQELTREMCCLFGRRRIINDVDKVVAQPHCPDRDTLVVATLMRVQYRRKIIFLCRAGTDTPDDAASYRS